MTNPANDPVSTVRIHPEDDPTSPTARRRIKLMSTEYKPYLGEGWMMLTTHDEWDTGGNTLTNDEQPADWPVQLLDEVARVLGHPESNADRCISCEHSLSDWHDATGCGYRIGQTRPNRTDTCTCGRAYPVPDPVEDIDTTQCEFAWDGGFRCALARGHEDPWHEDADGVRYHDDEPVPAAPSTVDTSVRERIRTAIDRVLDKPNGIAYRGTLPDAVLAALPELAELGKLRAERDELQRSHGCVCHNPNGGMFTWPCPQHSERVHLANEVKILRAKLAARNKAYGRASHEISYLRGQLARYKGYRHSVREFIADNRKIDAKITELGYKGHPVLSVLDKLATQRDHYRAEIDRCRAAAERVDHEHRQELKTLRAAREEARARARRAEQRTHEAFSVGDHVTWTDDDGTTHTGIIERTDYRIERLYDALEILESNGYTYNYLLPSEVTKLPKQENQ